MLPDYKTTRPAVIRVSGIDSIVRLNRFVFDPPATRRNAVGFDRLAEANHGSTVFARNVFSTTTIDHWMGVLRTVLAGFSAVRAVSVLGIAVLELL